MYTLKKSQLELQEAITNCDRCLVLKSMRSGKTLALLDFCKINKYKSILWIVDSADARENSLPEEIKKWGFKLNITIDCYGSIKKYKNKHYNIVILDEVQKMTTARSNNFSNIKFDKVVAMTGTLPTKKEKLDLLYNDLALKLVYSYTTDDAVDDDAAANYNIIIKSIPLEITKDIKIDYKDKFGKKQSFYTSEQGTYNSISRKLSIGDTPQRTKLLHITRLRHLNVCNSKIKYIKQYIKNNSNARILIFVATQDMAEKCSEYVYHGKSTKKYYDAFQKGEINHLVLVEKGTVGETYQDLDGCLLAAVNGSNTIIQQKIGRTLLFRKDYTSNIEIIISEGTVQWAMIERALIDLNKNKIKYES